MHHSWPVDVGEEPSEPCQHQNDFPEAAAEGVQTRSGKAEMMPTGTGIVTSKGINRAVRLENGQENMVFLLSITPEEVASTGLQRS